MTQSHSALSPEYIAFWLRVVSVADKKGAGIVPVHLDLCDPALPGVWAQFVHDEQVADKAFDNFKRSQRFKSLVESRLPAAISDTWNDVAGLSLVIAAHHAAIREYMALFPPASGLRQEKYLTTHLNLTEKSGDPYFYLAVWGGSGEEAYCMQRPGLTADEFRQYASGELTMGSLILHAALLHSSAASAAGVSNALNVEM